VRKYGKVDDNHSGVVSALRQAGCAVISLASVGQGCPDLLVSRNGSQGGINVLMEVKDGSKSPSKRKLTDDQRKFFATWKGPCFVVKSVEEALLAVNVS